MRALLTKYLYNDNERIYVWKKCVELGWEKLIGYDLVKCRNHLIKKYHETL